MLTWFRATCGVTAEDLDDGALVVMLLQRFLAGIDPENAPTPDRTRFVMVNEPDPEATDPAQAEARCDAQVVEMAPGPKRGHVTHTIAPAIRRAVLLRDDRRCQVPGCSNWIWLDLHHVNPRAHGGNHEETNVVTLCNVHHRVAHLDRLEIRSENSGFRFVFPDGRSLFVTSGPSKIPSTRRATPRAADRPEVPVVGITRVAESVATRQRT